MKSPLEEVTHTDNIKLSDDGRSVVIIDQTLLPNRLEYIALTTREEMFEAIAMLRVRGAPAIGICVGYCAYCLALQAPHDSFDDFYDHWVEDCRYLNGSRPTAVNLSWALNRMLDAADLPLPYVIRTDASAEQVEAALGAARPLGDDGYLLEGVHTRRAMEAAGLNLLAAWPVFR